MAIKNEEQRDLFRKMTLAAENGDQPMYEKYREELLSLVSRVK